MKGSTFNRIKMNLAFTLCFTQQKRTISQIALRQQLTRDVWKQILKLDNLEQFEESYALTQEWREWLLDPQINNNF